MIEFEKILQEELGIADDVINETNRIFNLVLEDLKTSVKTKNKMNITIQKGSFKTIVFNANINVNYTYRNVPTKELFDKIDNTSFSDGWSIYFSDKHIMCTIQFYGISGNINKQMLKSTIQHELEHIYEQKNRKKMFSDNEYYSQIKTLMDSSDENKYKIGRLLYSCIESEQNGFSNALYAYLMDIMDKEYSNEDLYESPIWKIYTETKQIFEELKNNIEMRLIAKNLLGDLYFLKIEKAINNFIRKIGKVVIKVKQDKIKLGWRN